MREFWRTMTGPKQGVYSLRRHNLLIETLRPTLTHHRIQIPRAAAADRIGSVDCTSGDTLGAY